MLHWNCMLTGTGLAGGGDFGAIVECSFGVGHEHWSGVLHIYCYWTWLSVVVHTWPASATHPPPTRVSRQRPAAKVSLKLRLLHGCLPPAGEKSAAGKKGIAEILLNGGAVSQTDQHIVAMKLLHRVQRQLFPDCIMSSQTWTLVGTASPQNGIRQSFMKLIH